MSCRWQLPKKYPQLALPICVTSDEICNRNSQTKVGYFMLFQSVLFDMFFYAKVDKFCDVRSAVGVMFLRI